MFTYPYTDLLHLNFSQTWQADRSGDQQQLVVEDFCGWTVGNRDDVLFGQWMDRESHGNLANQRLDTKPLHVGASRVLVVKCPHHRGGIGEVFFVNYLLARRDHVESCRS